MRDVFSASTTARRGINGVGGWGGGGQQMEEGGRRGASFRPIMFFRKEHAMCMQHPHNSKTEEGAVARCA